MMTENEFTGRTSTVVDESETNENTENSKRKSYVDDEDKNNGNKKSKFIEKVDKNENFSTSLDCSSSSSSTGAPGVNNIIQSVDEDAEGSRTVADMPPEVLLQIFSFLPYEDLVAVRLTNNRWKELSQDESLLKRIATRDFTWAPDLIKYLPPYLEITPDADATEYCDYEIYEHNKPLGLYKLCPDISHGGKAVYKQMDDFHKWSNAEEYSIWCHDSTWVVSCKVGGGVWRFKAETSSASPTTPIWGDYDYDSGKSFDDGYKVRVTSLHQLPPSCAITISCPKVPEDMLHPEVMGHYVATSNHCWGRVVFKHVDRELVLAVNDKGVWVVRDEVFDEEDDVLDEEDYVFYKEEYIRGPYHVGTCPSQVAQDEWDYGTLDGRWRTMRLLPKLAMKCFKH